MAANATNNHDLDREKLVVAQALVAQALAGTYGLGAVGLYGSAAAALSFVALLAVRGAPPAHAVVLEP